MKKQKMGLMSCILMGIGSIIGASVFASTPIAIKIVGGHGIVIGFILAALVVFVRSIPEMLLGSSLPATGGSYMYLTRLVPVSYTHLRTAQAAEAAGDRGAEGAGEGSFPGA